MATNFCETKVPNTGQPKCDIKLGKPVALLFAGSDIAINDVDALDLYPFFTDAFKADNPQNRIFPVSGIKQVDAANTEATMGTLAGYGYQEKLADGTLGQVFYFQANICRIKALAKLDGYTGRVFILTDNNLVVGVRNQAGNLAGLPLQNVSISADFIGDGVNVKSAKLTLNYGSDLELIERMDVVEYDFDVYELQGLTEVVLKKVDELTYKAFTACGGVDLYDSYADQLEDAALWEVINRLNGSPLTISAAVKVPARKAWQLTLVNPPAAPYRLSVALAAPSVLEAAGIVGFEQRPVFLDTQSV